VNTSMFHHEVKRNKDFLSPLECDRLRKGLRDRKHGFYENLALIEHAQDTSGITVSGNKLRVL
jgi:hypothetical protein